MTDRDKIIETMARASCQKVGDSPACRVACSGCKRHMEVALTALQASRMAVVPVESEDKRAALMDHEFHAGTRAGWDAAHAENPKEAFAALDKTQRERLSILSASPSFPPRGAGEEG